MVGSWEISCTNTWSKDGRSTSNSQLTKLYPELGSVTVPYPLTPGYAVIIPKSSIICLDSDMFAQAG